MDVDSNEKKSRKLMEDAKAKKAWKDFLEGETNIREDRIVDGKVTWEILEKSTDCRSNEFASKVLYELSKSSSTTEKQVLLLLSLGADPNWCCPFEWHCSIHHFARSGQYSILKHLLKMKRVLGSPRDKDGFTPLMVASRESSCRRNTLTMKTLLKRVDCGLDLLDYCGHSAVYHAWESKNLGALRKLLLAKASVFNCLKEFAEEVPLLYKLHKFIEFNIGDDLSRMPSLITMVSKPVELQGFFAATALHADMVDVYRNPSVVLSVRSLITGQTRALADGMIMFGLREELRSMKKYSGTINRPASSLNEIHVEVESKEEYDNAVQAVKQRRQAIRAMKLQQFKAKRKAEEEVAEEQRKKVELERIDKIFDTSKGRRDRDRISQKRTTVNAAVEF